MAKKRKSRKSKKRDKKTPFTVKAKNVGRKVSPKKCRPTLKKKPWYKRLSTKSKKKAVRLCKSAASAPAKPRKARPKRKSRRKPRRAAGPREWGYTNNRVWLEAG